MPRSAQPSSPANPDARAAAIGRAQRRAGLGRIARHLLVVAGIVFMVVETASLGLWVFGTETCDERGERCVVTEWYPMHLQPRARVETWRGEPDGLRIEYYADGTVHYAGTYAMGARVGPWREYYPNGEPRFEGMLEDGALVGVERWWYPGGALELEVGRVEGERHGLETWYYPSGEIRRVGTWERGEKRGVFRVFSPDGSLSFEAHYDDDEGGDGEVEEG